MPKRTTDYRRTLLERLTDPREAAYYVEAALEDSREMFFTALRDVAESRQMSRVAKDAGVAREALYRVLSESGNPTWDTLTSILGVLGLKLEIAPVGITKEPPTTSPLSSADRPVWNSTGNGNAAAQERDASESGRASTTKGQAVYAATSLVSEGFMELGAQKKPPALETELAMSAGILNGHAMAHQRAQNQ